MRFAGDGFGAPLDRVDGAARSCQPIVSDEGRREPSRPLPEGLRARAVVTVQSWRAWPTPAGWSRPLSRAAWLVAHGALMIALMLGGVALALAERERIAGIGMFAAATIKAPAVIVLAFLALGARRPRQVPAGTAVGLAATLALSAVAFDGQAWRFLGVLRGQQNLVGTDSFPHELARLFGLERVVPVTAIAHAALAVTAIALLVAVRRGADWLAASGWLLLVLVVATSFPLPWYTIWALPLAAISADRRLLAATLFIQGLLFAHQLGPLLTWS